MALHRLNPSAPETPSASLAEGIAAEYAWLKSQLEAPSAATTS